MWALFRLSFYREVEIGIGVGFVGKGKMPPLAVNAFKSVAEHRIAENEAVLGLSVQLARIIRMTLFAEPVKRRTHIEFLAGSRINERQVHR